jgi:hypothetical protein
MAPVETESKLTDDENLEGLDLRTEQWKMWKYLQAVVQFKRLRLKHAEAVAQMSYWSGLDPAICALMLDGLRKEKRSVLLRSKPKLTLLRFDD